MLARDLNGGQTMKNNLVFAAGLTAGVGVALSATLIAGQVTGLVGFSAGTPAKAAEVNGDFAAVKTAVDDNDARIAAVEAKLAKFGTAFPFAPVPGNGATCTLGEILLTASGVPNGTPAQGQILAINTSTALFSLLGTTYGGNGTTTFALPDLRGLAPNNLTYSICDSGVFPIRR
jgi:Phage Tail Collar Domain